MGRLVALALLGLAGCTADNPNTANMLFATGHVRVTPHPGDPTLLIVQHINTWDIGLSLDDAADRRVLVQRMLTAQCGAPTIEDARVTLTGSPQAVRQIRTYTLQVRCPNGASAPAER